MLFVFGYFPDPFSPRLFTDEDLSLFKDQVCLAFSSFCLLLCHKDVLCVRCEFITYCGVCIQQLDHSPSSSADPAPPFQVWHIRPLCVFSLRFLEKIVLRLTAYVIAAAGRSVTT